LNVHRQKGYVSASHCAFFLAALWLLGYSGLRHAAAWAFARWWHSRHYSPAARRSCSTAPRSVDGTVRLIFGNVRNIGFTPPAGMNLRLPNRREEPTAD